MSIYTGIEHEFIRLCVGSVYVCVLTVKAPVVVLCLQFCVTTNVRDCPQFFSHFVKSISAQLLLLLFTSLVSSHGIIMQCYHIFPRMVLNTLLSLTVSMQDPTLLYGWNLCS